MNIHFSTACPVSQDVHEYRESRTKNLFKRAIGALFLVLAVSTVLFVKLPPRGTERLIFSACIVFLGAGGVWWLLGRGEQCSISMKARLALIFGLLLAVFFPVVTSSAASVTGEKTGAVAGGAIFILLGIPTLIFGHTARRTIAGLTTLNGRGRAAVGLLCGYACFLGAGLNAATAFLLQPPAIELVEQKPLKPKPSAPTTVVRPTAPEGTYFLLSYKGVVTPKGVTGFPPGTQVEQVADQGTTLMVKSAGLQFEVAKSNLTNDLTLAHDLATADANQQYVLSSKAIAADIAASNAELQQTIRLENDRQAHLAAAPRSAPRYASPLERGAYGQTSSVAGKSEWMQGVTITKAQSEKLMGYFLDHAKPDTSIDLAPLPPLRSETEVRRARDLIQSETQRTDISRSDYNRLVERLHQLNAIPVGGPEHLESPYIGYEQSR